MRIIKKIYRTIRIAMWKAFYSKKIFIGKNFSFRKNLNISVRKNAKIFIGDNVFFNNDCSLNSHKNIIIGNDCIFGENVKIYDHNHVFNMPGKKIYEQGYEDEKIIIGNNCWIGTNCVILPGTVIGNNTVVGCGTIVKGEIPSNVIVTNSRKIEIKSIIYKNKIGD